jgi:hypothetical protein
VIHDFDPAIVRIGAGGVFDIEAKRSEAAEAAEADGG